MEKLIEEIKRRAEARAELPFLLAIDGSCAAGKTTLANRLAAEFDCNLFHLDDFFLRPAQRTPARLAQIGGNVDYERFREEVLLPLLAGSSFSYRPYDCGTGSLKEPVAVQPRRITVIEGSYSQHPYFGDPYDLKVFLDVTPQTREERIRQRPAFLHKRFFEEWIPMEQQYFQAFSIREKADLVFMSGEGQPGQP